MSSTIRHSVEGMRSPKVNSTQVLPIYEKFLHSDYVPTRDEIKLQSQALEDDYTKFDQIPQILEDWGMKIECAMEQIRLCEAALSPIRRVPVGLWRKIFSLFCFSGEYPISLYSSERDIPGTDAEPDNAQGYYNYKKESYIGVNACPYTLLSVCAHWHSIITGIPQLWSSIRIAGNFTLDLSPALDCLLSKSGNFPLNIHISSGYLKSANIHPNNRDNALQSIKFLSDHALPRCKHFIIDYSCCIFMTWERIHPLLPALESLETGHLSLIEAPILNHLKISHIHESPNIIRKFPLARLVSLEITNNVVLQSLVLRILPLCSALQFLSAPFWFAGNLYMKGSVFPDSPKEILSLQNLQIQITDFRQDLTFLFKYFELPNLSSLEIEVSDSSSSIFIPPVTLARGSDFPIAFYRSVSGLQKLTLLFQDIQYHKSSLNHIADLPGVLMAMSSLTSLEARQQGLSNPQPNILDALLILLIVSPDGTVGTIVLKLSFLSISYQAFLCFKCKPTSEVASFKKNILAMAESQV